MRWRRGSTVCRLGRGPDSPLVSEWHVENLGFYGTSLQRGEDTKLFLRKDGRLVLWAAAGGRLKRTPQEDASSGCRELLVEACLLLKGALASVGLRGPRGSRGLRPRLLGAHRRGARASTPPMPRHATRACCKEGVRPPTGGRCSNRPAGREAHRRSGSVNPRGPLLGQSRSRSPAC